MCERRLMELTKYDLEWQTEAIYCVINASGGLKPLSGGNVSE